MSESRSLPTATADHASLTCDLGKPETFGYLRFNTPYTEVAKLTFEYQDGTAWKPFFSVDHPKGNEWQESFPSVTAQVVRVTVEPKPKLGTKPDAKPGAKPGDALPEIRVNI